MDSSSGTKVRWNFFQTSQLTTSKFISGGQPPEELKIFPNVIEVKPFIFCISNGKTRTRIRTVVHTSLSHHLSKWMKEQLKCGRYFGYIGTNLGVNSNSSANYLIILYCSLLLLLIFRLSEVWQVIEREFLPTQFHLFNIASIHYFRYFFVFSMKLLQSTSIGSLVPKLLQIMFMSFCFVEECKELLQSIIAYAIYFKIFFVSSVFRRSLTLNTEFLILVEIYF